MNQFSNSKSLQNRSSNSRSLQSHQSSNSRSLESHQSSNSTSFQSQSRQQLSSNQTPSRNQTSVVVTSPISPREVYSSPLRNRPANSLQRNNRANTTHPLSRTTRPALTTLQINNNTNHHQRRFASINTSRNNFSSFGRHN